MLTDQHAQYSSDMAEEQKSSRQRRRQHQTPSIARQDFLRRVGLCQDGFLDQPSRVALSAEPLESIALLAGNYQRLCANGIVLSYRGQ